ncbi:hypothetical protein C8P63_1182 [Melghirimyces profundicolus]|uniref:Lipoprotein n=1 Tax=Melghirimyces profundicolus TaxID=1242148 RepID=A0A2T6BPZ0_9BACL|nr:DUF6612 family protein [Melghirimyces profundicolus]PTX58129.1 hypothetical protein C8P63_1182 [Melghirimyces profundicolus]
MKCKAFISFMLTFVLVMVSGCGLQQKAVEGDSPKEEAAEPKPEKLSMTQVVQKTQKASQKAKGYTVKSGGKQEISMEVEGQSQGITQEFDLKMDITQNPRAVHFSGTIQGGGQSGTVEGYQVGNEIYQTVDGSTWVKGTGADLNQFGGNQGQDPSQALQKLQELLSQIQGNKKDQALQMKETRDQYVITVNVMEDQPEVKELFLKQMTGSMVPTMKQAGVSVNESAIKLNKLKQVYHINKSTFEQEKMEQEMEVEIPVNDGTTSGVIKADQSMTLSLQGEFTGTIEVPQEVKESARNAQMQ